MALLLLLLFLLPLRLIRMQSLGGVPDKCFCLLAEATSPLWVQPDTRNNAELRGRDTAFVRVEIRQYD